MAFKVPVIDGTPDATIFGSQRLSVTAREYEGGEELTVIGADGKTASNEAAKAMIALYWNNFDMTFETTKKRCKTRTFMHPNLLNKN